MSEIWREGKISNWQVTPFSGHIYGIPLNREKCFTNICQKLTMKSEKKYKTNTMLILRTFLNETRHYDRRSRRFLKSHDFG